MAGHIVGATWPDMWSGLHAQGGGQQKGSEREGGEGRTRPDMWSGSSSSTRACSAAPPAASPLSASSAALPAASARSGLVERFAKTLRQKSATFERNVCARHTLW